MPHIPVKPKACVIGYPAKHSRSPLIHGFWLKEYGLSGQYECAEIPPTDVANFITGLARNGYIGANVTVPHKETACRLADHLTETARLLGAVNTLYFKNGLLWGDNTDGEGFLANLDACVPGWDCNKATAVVLGAGGAARAIIHALMLRGVRRIVVANRTQERVQALVDHFNQALSHQVSLEQGTSGQIEVIGWSQLTETLPVCDLLINTTSLGMRGQPPLLVDLSSLPPSAVVVDAVYVPLETPLLAAAKARGLKTVGGLGMLLHQAVPGFERWFGKKPTVSARLQALVEADIEARI